MAAGTRPRIACPVCGTSDIITKNGHNYYACGRRCSDYGYLRGCDNSDSGDFKQESPKQELTCCTCDDKALFWGGCKCGWIQKERAAKV